MLLVSYLACTYKTPAFVRTASALSIHYEQVLAEVYNLSCESSLAVHYRTRQQKDYKYQ